MEIATDYVSIPFWKETNPDFFVIPSSELKFSFIEKGFKEDMLLPIGIPVFKKYSDKYSCKEALELDLNSKYILILTGSMGFGKVAEMLESLLQRIANVFH